MKYLISDFDLLDADLISQQRTLLELLSISIWQRLGEIACQLIQSHPNAALITTGHGIESGEVQFGALFWIARFDFYDEELGIVRFHWSPVSKDAPTCTVPLEGKMCDYEFTCLIEEAVWVVMYIASNLVANSQVGLLPEHHKSWWDEVDLSPKRELTHSFFSDDGSIASYIWTTAAHDHYHANR